MLNIGFVGLGAMGKPMALNLVKSGHKLMVFDVVAAAVQELVAAGATEAQNVGEIAEKADILVTMLPNANIVELTLNNFFPKAKKGQIIVDMSTVATNSTLKMAKKAEELGIDYVDAPVSGGFTGAEKGTLTIMIGGKEEIVNKVMPLFEIMGSKLYHVGGVGAGNSMKLVNNLLLGCNMAAISEALALGVKSGLNVEKMYEIIKVSSGASYALDAKVPAFIMERNFKPGFAIDLQYKDLELAIETGKSQNVPMPLTTLSQQVFEMARAQGLGREDISAVIKVWEKMIGTEV